MIDARFRTLAALALCAGITALTACTYWSSDFDRIVDQTGRDFKIDPGRTYNDVAFDDLVASPTSYKFRHIRFMARLDQRNETIFVPMYGVFKQEDHTAFSLWSVDAPVWEKKARDSSLPTFYMRKDNPALDQLEKLDQFDEVSLRGTVLGDFENVPFVEIHYIDPISVHSTTRAKYVLEVEEAENLLKASAPVFQEVAAQAATLPDDPAELRDLHAKATKVKTDLSQANFRYKMSLYHAPDPIATRNRIIQIDGLLDTLAQIIQAIEDKQAR